jgi:hypothetical protein
VSACDALKPAIGQRRMEIAFARLLRQQLSQRSHLSIF